MVEAYCSNFFFLLTLPPYVRRCVLDRSDGDDCGLYVVVVVVAIMLKSIELLLLVG